MAAFAEVDAPDFGLAPVGADLQDAKAEAEAPKLDLSRFSVAPVGSDMGQARPEPAAPARTPATCACRTEAGSGLRQAWAWGG